MNRSHKERASSGPPIPGAAPVASGALPDPQGRLRLAKIRHDLRTPINHIIGYAEILQEETADRVPPGFLNDLQKIQSGGNQLLALINQHLNEESFFAGRHDLRSLCHDLRTPVNHIIGYGELLAEQCDELGQPGFKADLAKITRAARTWLTLMEEQLSGHLTASPARSLPRPSAAEARSISRMQQSWSAGPLPEQHPLSARGGKLLLADDDETNRDLLRRRLEKLGYQITVCGDGRAALKLAREGQFDLVLLDMLMPHLDGQEVLAQMKADPALRHLPVIMISALDRLEGIVRCIELGAEDYLAKPFNPVLLRARVTAALEKKRLRDWEQIYLRQIEEERSRSDRLLLNILPRPIADRLKRGEGSIVDSFGEVTVMFADLVGFTTLSVQIQPSQVVRLLDEIFTAFDALADRHGLEKIKTIGDAYMVVAGLPLPRTDHARATAAMALDMLETLREFNHQRQTALQMRIGISTGPVIAGIIGRNKFAYDLWGDTVNTASRMESHGVPGRVQVAPRTYELLCEEFQFEDRGTIEVRGKGPMKTYLLRG